MTRRSALLAGLAVLVVLLGGQVVATWQQRPPSSLATVGNEAPPGGVTPSAAPSPTDTDASPGPPGQTGPSGQPGQPGNGRPSGGGPAAAGVKNTTGNAGIALTFDDGPHPVYTPQILAVLRANRVRAVFCLVGSEVRRHPQLVAQIAREGHTLCNHSWRHEINLGSWPAARIRENLQRTNNEIRRAVPGARIAYFRQPGGRWTATGTRVARQLGMTSLGWTVDPRDWQRPAARAIKSRVLRATSAGSVVLLHDAGGNRSTTVAACRSFIPLLSRKFRIVQIR